LNAGQLDRVIVIEEPESTPDANYGTPVITWVQLATVRAQVQDMLPSRSETTQQDVAMARNQTRIRMRWRSDVTSDMRITVKGNTEDSDRVLQIIGGPAEIFGRKAFLEVLCEAYSS
jgi:SPP1 family predicted phage head-tail adaptor